MALQPFCWTLVAFSISESSTQSVGLLVQGINRSQGRYIHTEQHKQNKRTQTSIPWVGFESTITAFERAKTVHTLDRATSMIAWNKGVDCQKISQKGPSLLGRDLDCYVIRKLLSILNTPWESKLLCQRSYWTQDCSSVRLATQGMIYIKDVLDRE
jgi:hypothetical protein